MAKSLLAPIIIVDGTFGAPTISFASEPTLGIYRPVAGTLGVAGNFRAYGNIDAVGDGLGYNLENLLSVDNARLAGFKFQTAGSNRWAVRKTNASETGANAGSPFQIKRYDDAGSLIDNPLQIDRDTGLWNIVNNVKLSGGQLYGTAIHNHPSGMAGTTNQHIGSGTYTPTPTNHTNITGSTMYVAQHMRVGNVVTVAGKVDVDPTTTLTAFELRLSLPIAAAFASDANLCGMAINSQGKVARIIGLVSATGVARIVTSSDIDDVNRGWQYMYQYLVS